MQDSPFELMPSDSRVATYRHTLPESLCQQDDISVQNLHPRIYSSTLPSNPARGQGSPWPLAWEVSCHLASRLHALRVADPVPYCSNTVPFKNPKPLPHSPNPSLNSKMRQLTLWRRRSSLGSEGESRGRRYRTIAVTALRASKKNDEMR